jgi:exonuclease SbcD
MTERPFRLIHTSDWHLGHELHGHDRIEEHDAFFDWLIDQRVTREGDALVLTGHLHVAGGDASTESEIRLRPTHC